MTTAKILIVEDEVMLAKELARVLKRSEYDVVGRASTGEEAIQKAKETLPDLILMDINLEDAMDGIETASQIQSSLDTAIIYLTGHTAPDVFERAKTTEPYAYLTKPVSPQELGRTVDMALYKRQLDRRLKESESKYRTLVEQSFQGLVIAQSNPLRLSFVSNPMQGITGYSTDELMAFGPEDLTGLIHEEDREEFFRSFQERLAGKDVPPKNQYRIIRRDGAVRWVESFSSLIEYNGEAATQTVFMDITDRKQAEESLKESEARVRLKLNSILEPEGDIGVLELADVIDAKAVQSLMDDFYSLTNIGVAILDIKGKVLVATGWQDICTQFHRAHPETNENCRISDTHLSSGVEEGSFKLYRCNNNMWDIATPIIVGGKHLGNLFLGQFLFDDEEINYELFRLQARKYGFDEQSYIAALEEVPRWNKGTVDSVMNFYMKFMTIVSNLSHSNLMLARTLTQRDELVDELQRANSEMNRLLECSKEILNDLDFTNIAENVFRGCCEATGAASGYVAVLKEDGSENEVVFLESGGLACSVDPSLPMPIRGLRAEVYKNGEVVYDNDFANSHWTNYLPEGHVILENVLFAPLKIENKTVGILGLANKEQGFDERDVRLATIFGELAAMGLSRTRAIQALTESEDRYRLLVENANEAIFVVQDGLFKFVNSRCPEMSGYSTQELLEMSFTDLIHPEDHEEVASYHRTRLQGDLTPYSYSFRFVNRSGHVKWVNLNSVSISWNDRPAGLCFLSDISEIKKAEELALSAERLKAVGELAGGVAHNFNNLLQIVLGGASLAITDLEFGNVSRAKTNLEHIIESSKFGAETVKRLQEFARVRKGAPLGKSRIFDLASTVNEAIEMSKPWWKTKPEKEGISVNLSRYIEKGCYVEGNENELFEVAVNLIKNAAEALEKGGEIKIRTAIADDTVQLVVEDNGVGLSNEQSIRVFDPFWTTKGPQGTGMGLSSSYGIAQKHGGEITVKSNLGEGAVFKVKLPLRSESPGEKKSNTALDFDFKYNILVVDDMPAVVKQIEGSLVTYGQKVFASTSGLQALEIFKETKIDVVICDLAMPEINGWQVGYEILEICRNRGTPKPVFIMLTGWGGQIDEEKKKEASGVDVILEKPVDAGKLMKEIQRLSNLH